MQSEWQRKEYLHLTIIQNFDRGKVSTPWPRPQTISETPTAARGADGASSPLTLLTAGIKAGTTTPPPPLLTL